MLFNGVPRRILLAGLAAAAALGGVRAADSRADFYSSTDYTTVRARVSGQPNIIAGIRGGDGCNAVNIRWGSGGRETAHFFQTLADAREFVSHRWEGAHQDEGFGLDEGLTVGPGGPGGNTWAGYSRDYKFMVFVGAV